MKDMKRYKENLVIEIIEENFDKLKKWKKELIDTPHAIITIYYNSKGTERFYSLSEDKIRYQKNIIDPKSSVKKGENKDFPTKEFEDFFNKNYLSDVKEKKKKNADTN